MNDVRPGSAQSHRVCGVVSGYALTRRVTHPRGPQLLGDNAPIEKTVTDRTRITGSNLCFRQLISAIAAKLDRLENRLCSQTESGPD
jgi:hypothetical protein